MGKKIGITYTENHQKSNSPSGHSSTIMVQVLSVDKNISSMHSARIVVCDSKDEASTATFDVLRSSGSINLKSVDSEFWRKLKRIRARRQMKEQ